METARTEKRRKGKEWVRVRVRVRALFFCNGKEK
jgi:hypothetical protein